MNTCLLTCRRPVRPGTAPASPRGPAKADRSLPGASPKTSAVIAVRARGQMAFARTPYRPSARRGQGQRGDAGLWRRRSWNGRPDRTDRPREVLMMRPYTDPPLLGLAAPVGGGVAGQQEMPAQVNGDDEVEVLVGHVEQHPVAGDAGVVDHDVQAAQTVGAGHQLVGGRALADVARARRPLDPAALISSSTSEASSARWMSLTTTVAPARPDAPARPSPAAAPVTTATRPRDLMGSSDTSRSQLMNTSSPAGQGGGGHSAMACSASSPPGRRGSDPSSPMT